MNQSVVVAGSADADLAGAFGQMRVGPVAVPGPVLGGVPMVGVIVGPAVVAGAVGPVPMEVDSATGAAVAKRVGPGPEAMDLS